MPKNRTFSLRFVRFFGIFAKSKNFYKYKIFSAFSPWPPVNIRATTGRPWADHGRQADRTEIEFRKKKFAKIKKKFAKIFSRKKLSRANFVFILILHVKLSKRYPIVRKKRNVFLYCHIVATLDETPHPVKF